jgi:lysozyme
MKITPEGVALIKQFEGLALAAYRCPAGRWTIGYGHTGPGAVAGRVITPAEAEMLLRADLARFDAFVRLKCPSATPAQHSAMVSLCFNIGERNFAKSSVLRLHQRGDVTGAARAFALWNKATAADGKRRELRGLTRRRAAEAALYLADDGQGDAQRTRAGDVIPEKPLTRSRVMIGSTVGGMATLASGAAELAEHLEWLRSLVLPLVPYLPSLQAVFVALGLAGIVLAMIARWADRKHGRL